MTDNINLRLLQLLAQKFPNSERASAEIINLEAILSLPKGTEHFVADIHGEHEAFLHILRNASGNIKRKVCDLFGDTLSEKAISDLCTLIYYPEKRLEMIETETNEDLSDFYARTLLQLIGVCRSVSSKYTRSKVRKALPRQFAYIIEELLHENPDDDDKDAYVHRIVETIIQTGQAHNFIVAVCNVIQRLSIDRLHILGDIFDRGPGAHIIMDYLLSRENYDIQWGNHDILWMGAAAGNEACICNVLRLSLRYANLFALEDGYGINLLPLATFAMEAYADDPCSEFMPMPQSDAPVDEKSMLLMAKMHKAITIIQFKKEAELFRKHPEWEMADRCLLPDAFTEEENELMQKLHHSFRISEKLHRHIRTLLSHGSMYSICDQNLLFHASVPLNEDGSLKEVEILGKSCAGRELMDYIGQLVRAAFQNDTPAQLRSYAIDYFLYLWCGKNSPLFDKSKMATYERYFNPDPATHHEEKGAYYKLREDPAVCSHILDSFGVKGEKRHIINGHVPIHASRGETPIKAGGMLMVIDGGFSKPYHHTTGIAGYTLVYHSRGFQLIQHEPFTSTQEAVANGTDIKSSTQIVEMMGRRIRVRDTDMGLQLRQQIDELQQLLYAYRHGLLKENTQR